MEINEEVDITLTSGEETPVGLRLLADSAVTIDLAGQALEIVQKEK